MRRVVFYSWQSDLPNATNRGFIQQALELAASAIAADETVEVQPVIDRDTQGVPGSPDIAGTIFAKITASDVVVADITPIGKLENGRSTPNPNVLIELGYALRGLGAERVILVFNRAFGKVEDLPFDLRMRRLMLYEAAAKNTDRSSERSKLAKQLEEAIRVALSQIPSEVQNEQLIRSVDAIENNQPSKIVVLRRDLDVILKDLDELQPRRHRDGGTAEELIAGIGATQDAIARFTRIAHCIAVMNDKESAVGLYHWLGKCFERYDLPRNYAGTVSSADCDYFKFIGHECIVTLFAFLLREQRWNLIEFLLTEPIPVQYLQAENGPGLVDWQYASEHLNLLREESHKRSRVSLHADLLSERHTTGRLATVLSFDQFLAADFFLYLCGELSSDEPPQWLAWRAWSCLYLRETPMFIKAAERRTVAESLVRLFGLAEVEQLKERLEQRTPRLEVLFRHALWRFKFRPGDIERIGTR